MAQDEAAAPSSSSSSGSASASASASGLSVSISRNASFCSTNSSSSCSNSRLNAQAPAFVPSIRNNSDPHAPIPSPPGPPSPPNPQGMLQVYHSPFHLPLQPHLVTPPHVIPIQNHHLHHSHPLPLHQYPHSYYTPSSGDTVLGDRDLAHQSASSSSDHSNSNFNSKNNKVSEDSNLKILNQVEYYFSDLNLATTDHLMRFIHKDPEGFVPISVVASFKKIKALIRSNGQLAAVLRNSSKLVVSEDGKKVRRQQPLDDSDMEELQSRIIVAENLPEDHCHQNLMKIFSAVGGVRTIRTCQPQASNGGASSASRLTKADSMLYSNKLHAFVEYDSAELAEKAVSELNDEGNWSGLRVRIMIRCSSKPAQARVKKGHDGDMLCEEDDSCMTEQSANEKQLEDPSQQSDIHSQEHVGEEHGNNKEVGQRKGRNRGRNKGRGRGQYHQSNRGNHMGSSPSNNSISNELPCASKQPPGPRMPDGTKGFAMGRGKPVAVNIT